MNNIKIKAVNLVSEASGLQVRAVGNRAFSDLGIRTLDIPEPVVCIGDEAFAGCEDLKELKLPKTLKYIGHGAFKGCKSLEEVEIPAGVLTIDDGAFADCENLKKVTMNGKVKTIGKKAFDTDCEIVFPDYVEAPKKKQK